MNDINYTYNYDVDSYTPLAPDLTPLSSCPPRPLQLHPECSPPPPPAAAAPPLLFDAQSAACLGVPQRPAPDLVMDQLYLGDEKDAYTKMTLARLNITHVVTVTNVPDFTVYRDLFPPNVKCLVVDIDDRADQNISQYFNQTNAFIEAGRRVGNVLVHCVYGISRSASIVIAYVMSTRCLDFATAFRMVHRCRPIICPNVGFRHQLINYGRRLLAVTFSIHFTTKFGQQLHLVGSSKHVGGWEITDGNKMEWTDGNIWRITVPVRGARFEYKYVVADETTGGISASNSNSGKGVRWETRANRVYEGMDRERLDVWDQTGVGCSAQQPTQN
ncbi:dual specificity protein phosphatase 1 [Pelomyxa schiedti]|nr:dual specificity protein phosphatase 1 [Pelomyxa schiedti]